MYLGHIGADHPSDPCVYEALHQYYLLHQAAQTRLVATWCKSHMHTQSSSGCHVSEYLCLQVATMRLLAEQATHSWVEKLDIARALASFYMSATAGMALQGSSFVV
jgi:hypothetical protein